MNKFLSNLVNPLLVLLAGTFITAFLRDPIDEIANQNRLKATVELAPWIQKIDEADKTSNSNERFEMILQRVWQSRGYLGVARLNLENSSKKRISNISFDIPGDPKTEAIIIRNGEFTSRFKNPNQIKIGDMLPGDNISVLVWGSYNTFYFKDEFKSYSSEGPFRTQFFWPEDQGIDREDYIYNIVELLIWSVGSVSIILLLAITGIGWYQHWEYNKLLLTYRKAYEMERERFWSNPKKFTPDASLINEKFYRPHQLLGEPDNQTTEKPTKD